ncbi:MAG: selenide, water dikinase SelD [Candidatus Brocadia sp. UTAMX2]|jgi:selenide,water dikinase|nr:MAG: selenide, water dikinase SelD [Candidatus Brocadia sp. UTAMX2]
MAYIVRHLPEYPNDRVLVGLKTFADAGIYKINDDLALVETLDFFTPVVNNPYDYGQIAAANALSDVYAMGGKPLTAMNILCYPLKSLDKDVLVEILKGGADKINEAGATVVGGHTLQDNEIKYGLSVTGIIHPGKIVTNAGARPGDALVLTKPLGTGLIIAAIKANKVFDEDVSVVTRSMTLLNKTSSETMLEVGANSCTDITGFGLMGHAFEMAEASRATLSFSAERIPIFDGCERYVRMGLIPGVSKLSKKYLKNDIRIDSAVREELIDVLFDAQTSGGLLISLQREKAETLCKKLQEKGVMTVGIVGEVWERRDVSIVVLP